MTRSTVLLAALLVLLVACAAPLGPKFEGPHPGKAGYATVYVYRQHDGLLQGIGASLLVDGKPAADLVPRGYMVLLLTPGSHVFRPQWDARPQSGPATRVTVREDEELFMKFHSGLSAAGQMQSFSARWSEVARGNAMQELREYSLVAVVSP